MHSPMRCGRFPQTTNQAKALCARGWNDQDSHPAELWSTGPSKSTVVPRLMHELAVERAATRAVA